MSDYTPTTAHVREVFSNRPGCDYVKQRLEFNRWLWAHNATLVTEFMQQPEFQEMLATRDVVTRAAALEEAAGIADAIGLKRKSNACLEVVEAIRAVAGTS